VRQDPGLRRETPGHDPSPTIFVIPDLIRDP
jgi:hypothetical protein